MELGKVWWAGLGLVVAYGFAAVPASAVQFSLAGDERLNFFNSALPGTNYETAAGGVDYDGIGSGGAHEGTVVASGTIPALEYHTTGAPGTNQTETFATPLVFTLEAELVDVIVTQPIPAIPAIVRVTFVYEGVAGADLTVTDPTDSTVLLTGNIVPGTFEGVSQSALTATTANFNILAPPQNLNVVFQGFFQVDGGLPYSPLLADSVNNTIGFVAGVVSDFEIGDLDGFFDFNDIVAALGNPPLVADVISNTSEANGEAFALQASDFSPIPEPGTALLVSLGLAGLGTMGRRGRL
jgi:hypothetical protein